MFKNIAKGTTDPRVEFILPKQLLEVISIALTQILIKFHLQNFDQESSSKSQPRLYNSPLMPYSAFQSSLLQFSTCSKLLLAVESLTTFTSCGQLAQVFFNLRKLFTAFSSCCDIIMHLVSLTAIKSTKQE